LSTCNTNWGVSVLEAMQWLKEHMLPMYPLGDYKVSPALENLRV
ncbi:MAG: 2-oxoglutarate oxidoreductase, partial [Anaerolineales bacterium]